jgi:signal transduction histidine kinase/ActR/RegA family two-component response regulator
VITTIPSESERRVLVRGPSAKDAQITRSILEDNGIPCVVCPNVHVLLGELHRGAGAVIVAEEAIHRGEHEPLRDVLDRQHPWSDVPVIVITATGGTAPGSADAFADLGNVSLLERPVRVQSLISAVRSALRARARQYQLRDHVRERERAAEELKEADRRKDEFLAILAHELRNPLAPIRNALNIMRLAGPEGAAASGMREMLERQVDHMVRLVDDLFEASRISRGRIELRLEPIDLAAVIRHSVETSRPLMDAARQLLEVDIDVEPLPMSGDPIRLAQVFANLLNNASKFSEEGGVIMLAAHVRKGFVDVSVRDWGAGILPEMLPRVFDMFAQGQRRAERSPGGLGIGLSLAKRLVESHGGRVEARSDGPGCGSDFTVRLPLTEEVSPGDVRTSTARMTGRLRPRRILVVDDNHDSAESVGLLLKLLGADVHMTFDGPSALAAVDSWRPEIVLMDIGLPGMDGYEVARRIRQRSEFDRLTLIALSGWGQEEDRIRSRAAGFQHHLLKPADPGTLQALLSTLDAGSRKPGPDPSNTSRGL